MTSSILNGVKTNIIFMVTLSGLENYYDILA